MLNLVLLESFSCRYGDSVEVMHSLNGFFRAHHVKQFRERAVVVTSAPLVVREQACPDWANRCRAGYCHRARILTPDWRVENIPVYIFYAAKYADAQMWVGTKYLGDQPFRGAAEASC
jgi:hypothetical protein